MAKDPAFLFYPGDWLGGTMLLTRHQKGCYIDLLMAQFNSGPLSLDQIKTVLGQDQAMWTVLREKFKTDNSGRFFNEKLATETEKRKAYVASRSENRSEKTKKQTYDKSHEKHMNNHMENEIKIKDVKEKTKEKPSEIVPIYRKFKHLALTVSDFDKLVSEGWHQSQIDQTLDSIENFKQNTKYTSLLITCRNWLRKDSKPTGIDAILSANKFVKNFYPDE